MNQIKICKNPKNYNITKGKKYEVKNFEKNFIWIDNDLGNLRKYRLDLFEDPKPEIIKEDKIFVELFDTKINLITEKSKENIEIKLNFQINGLEFNSTSNCSTFFVNGMATFSSNLLKFIATKKRELKEWISNEKRNKAKFYIDESEEIDLNVLESIIESKLIEHNARIINDTRSVCHLVAASTLGANQDQVEIMDKFWPVVSKMLNNTHGDYSENNNLLIKRVRENPNSHNIVHIYLI